MTIVPPTTDFQPWLQALQQLDAHLAIAINQASGHYGPGAAADPHRGLYLDEAQIDRLLNRPIGQPLFFHDQTTTLPPRLQWLTQRFNLSTFDCDILLLAIAPDLDLRYERLYAYLQDDITRRLPTLDLALNLLCRSPEEKLQRRQHFNPSSPLINQGILCTIADPNQVQPPLLAHYLKLDDRIRQFLLGDNSLADKLRPIAQLETPKESTLPLSPTQEEELQRAIAQTNRLYLQGSPGQGKHRIAKTVAIQLQRPLLTIDLPQLADLTLLPQILRETRLWNAVLYLAGADSLEQIPNAKHISQQIQTEPGLILLGGSLAQAPLEGDWRHFVMNNLDRTQRRDYWQQALSRAGIQLSETEFNTLTDRFNLTPAQIDRTLSQSEPTLTHLLAAARQQSDQTLSRVAQKLSPKYQWADIILPPEPLAQLQEIGNQARLRSLVYEQWGFDRKLSLGKGLNVLFAGPPGTGKTMAAEVIANDLQLDLYKIDLSQVVSKYIGETEKNLDRIFTAARTANAILFFDEADALFGKRSEVKDAHDRYANIEVGYLLQKMEEYEGTAILATNLRQNMDDAFVRRIQVIVEFPFPDQAFRQQIWRVMFPPELPLGAIDFDWLAQEIKLPGGNIKNIALAAAFLAANDGQVVTMGHLSQAAQREYQKLGRSWITHD
ncbi:MAG: ATP-binding protein [Alkalinema sp. RU_4_3]|nr:ATP-binding protein [Alkalinema sp. RU_4_3]